MGLNVTMEMKVKQRQDVGVYISTEIQPVQTGKKNMGKTYKPRRP